MVPCLGTFLGVENIGCHAHLDMTQVPFRGHLKIFLMSIPPLYIWEPPQGWMVMDNEYERDDVDDDE